VNWRGLTLARIFVLLVLLALLVVNHPATSADKNTGSAQPYVGYTVVGPFVITKPGRTLTIEIALAFTPKFESFVTSLEFGRQKKEELTLRLYEVTLYEFLDTEGGINRDRMREIVRGAANEFLKGNAIQEVRLTKFRQR